MLRNLFIVSGLFFCFLFGPIASAWSESGGLVSLPKSAEIEALWEAGQKSQAQNKVEKWMEEEKKSPWPWVQAASLSFRQEKLKRSLAYVNTALEKSPLCADAYYWRGRIFEAQKKPLDAANEYRAALIAEQKYQEAQDALARVLALLES